MSFWFAESVGKFNAVQTRLHFFVEIVTWAIRVLMNRVANMKRAKPGFQSLTRLLLHESFNASEDQACLRIAG